jgi:hypothetical protein
MECRLRAPRPEESTPGVFVQGLRALGSPPGVLSRGLRPLDSRQGVHPLDLGCGLSIWHCQMESPKGPLKAPPAAKPRGRAAFFIKTILGPSRCVLHIGSANGKYI